MKTKNGEKVLRANRFELVDNSGGVCARLEMIPGSADPYSKKGPALTLFGENGHKRVRISFSEDETIGESADIELCDRCRGIRLPCLPGEYNPHRSSAHTNLGSRLCGLRDPSLLADDPSNDISVVCLHAPSGYSTQRHCV